MSAFDVRYLELFPLTLALACAVVLILYLIKTLVRSALEEYLRSASRFVTVSAGVSAKRIEVKSKPKSYKAQTLYFTTFELDTGERREFELSSGEYAVLTERDFGRLTYYKGRFKGFERI